MATAEPGDVLCLGLEWVGVQWSWEMPIKQVLFLGICTNLWLFLIFCLIWKSRLHLCFGWHRSFAPALLSGCFLFLLDRQGRFYVCFSMLFMFLLTRWLWRDVFDRWIWWDNFDIVTLTLMDLLTWNRLHIQHSTVSLHHRSGQEADSCPTWEPLYLLSYSFSLLHRYGFYHIWR